MGNYRYCICVLIIASLGCVKAPLKPNQQLCLIAQSNVQQRLGPEFRRVLNAQLLYDDQKGTYGCAIAYQRVDEELAEEFGDDFDGLANESHLVAFISRLDGKPARFLEVRRTRTAPGPVTVSFQTIEVTGDDYVDLVVVERGKRANTLVDYQGLKIVNGDPSLTSEIFESSLLTRTPEQSEVLTEWSVENPKNAAPILVLRTAQNTTRYQFSSMSRRMLPIQRKGELKADSTGSERVFQADELSNSDGMPTQRTRSNQSDKTKAEIEQNEETAQDQGAP